MPPKSVPPLQGRRAWSLQEDLFKEYIKSDFQKKLYTLYQVATEGTEMAEARHKASIEVQFRIIPKYGFEPTRAGALHCQHAFDYGTGEELGLRGEYLVFMVTQERQELVARRFLPQIDFASLVGTPPHLDLLKRCKPRSNTKRLWPQDAFDLQNALIYTYSLPETQQALRAAAARCGGDKAAKTRQEACAAVEGPVVAQYGFSSSSMGVLEAWFSFCNKAGALGNFGSRGEWHVISETVTANVHQLLYLIDSAFHYSEIRVCSAEGSESISIAVDPAHDVRALKQQLQCLCGVPELEQRLLLGADELHNSSMLHSFVPLGTTVDVVFTRRSAAEAAALAQLRDSADAKRAPCSLPEELMAEPQFMVAAVQEHAQALRLAMGDQREVVIAAVGYEGRSLRFAAEALRDDDEVAFRAVCQNGMALEYASDRLRAERWLVLAAVQQDGSALEFAAEAFRADRGVVLEAVRGDGFAIALAADALKADRELACAAVTQEWKVLRHLTPEMKADKEVVLAALREDGQALQFAAPELQNDRECVKLAVESSGEALHFASSALRSDRALAMAAIAQDGLALRCVRPEAQDLEMVLAACRQNKLAVQFVAPSLRAALAEAQGEQGIPDAKAPSLPDVVVIPSVRQKLKRHFQTLGLNERAPEEHIRRRYRQLALQHHPDKHPDDVEGAKRRFQQIGSAYHAIKEGLGL